MGALFIVGQHRGMTAEGFSAWDFQGVFSTKDEAIGACRDRNYFVLRAQLGVSLPHEPNLTEVEYPLAEKT